MTLRRGLQAWSLFHDLWLRLYTESFNHCVKTTYSMLSIKVLSIFSHGTFLQICPPISQGPKPQNFIIYLYYMIKFILHYIYTIRSWFALKFILYCLEIQIYSFSNNSLFSLTSKFSNNSESTARLVPHAWKK